MGFFLKSIRSTYLLYIYESVKHSEIVKQCPWYSNTIFPSFWTNLQNCDGKAHTPSIFLAVVLVLGLEGIQQLLKLNG